MHIANCSVGPIRGVLHIYYVNHNKKRYATDMGLASELVEVTENETFKALFYHTRCKPTVRVEIVININFRS
jgi:hypothetical protein